MGGEEAVERPFPSAQWGYVGEWTEFEANHRRYRWRVARADDGSWARIVVQHQTRNGWDTVGKKVNEGITIAWELAATLIEDLARELADEIDARYGEEVHPALWHKYEQDTATVKRAKKFLSLLGAP